MAEQKSTLKVEPWTVIGYRADGRPIYAVAGGSGEDSADTGTEGQEQTGTSADDSGRDKEDDTSDQDDDSGQGGAKDTDDADSGKEKEDDWRPPTKAEMDRIQGALARAKREARERREKLAELQRTNEGAEEKAEREARESVTAELEKKYKPLIIRTHAKADLMAAGLPEKKVPKATKLLDLDELEIDEDGNVDGLDEQVTKLKEEWPELFAEPESSVKAKPTRSSKAVDGADKPPAKKRLSAEERAMLMLQGRKM